MALDTDKIKPYRRASPPSMPDQGRYVADELQRIEQTLGTLTIVLKSLEARLVVGHL